MGFRFRKTGRRHGRVDYGHDDPQARRRRVLHVHLKWNLVLAIVTEHEHLTPDDIQACLAYASEVLKAERVYLLPT